MNFTRWLDLAGDQISKAREAKDGHITLTFFTDDEEDKMRLMYLAGIPPKWAAKVFLCGALS